MTHKPIAAAVTRAMKAELLLDLIAEKNATSDLQTLVSELEQIKGPARSGAAPINGLLLSSLSKAIDVLPPCRAALEATPNAIPDAVNSTDQSVQLKQATFRNTPQFAEATKLNIRPADSSPGIEKEHPAIITHRLNQLDDAQQRALIRSLSGPAGRRVKFLLGATP